MKPDKLLGMPTRWWDITEDSPKVVDEVRSQEGQRGREIILEPWESSPSPGGRFVTHTIPPAKVLLSPCSWWGQEHQAAMWLHLVSLCMFNFPHCTAYMWPPEGNPVAFCPGVLKEMTVADPGRFTCGQGPGVNSQWV